MNKKEVNEIKKNFSENCGFFTIENVVTAMVSTEKNIFYTDVRPAYSIPMDEIELIIATLKKILSGKLGKTLREYSFMKEAYLEGGRQQMLYDTVQSRYKNKESAMPLIEAIAGEIDYVSTYSIISAACTYSVLNTDHKRRTENIDDDASEQYDYTFIITAICPVNLHFEGLIYDDIKQIVCKKEGADRIIEPPTDGFLFPLFNDRAPDINGILYYAKKPKDANIKLIEDVLECESKMNCTAERETFNYILRNVVGEDLDLETITSIQNNIKARIDSKAHKTEAVMLDCGDISSILWESGIEQEKLSHLPKVFESSMGNSKALTAGNLIENKTAIETTGITVNVSEGYEDKVRTEIKDGKKYIVIAVDDPEVVVNGLEAKIT